MIKFIGKMCVGHFCNIWAKFFIFFKHGGMTSVHASDPWLRRAKIQDGLNGRRRFVPGCSRVSLYMKARALRLLHWVYPVQLHSSSSSSSPPASKRRKKALNQMEHLHPKWLVPLLFLRTQLYSSSPAEEENLRIQDGNWFHCHLQASVSRPSR